MPVKRNKSCKTCVKPNLKKKKKGGALRLAGQRGKGKMKIIKPPRYMK